MHIVGKGKIPLPQNTTRKIYIGLIDKLNTTRDFTWSLNEQISVVWTLKIKVCDHRRLVAGIFYNWGLQLHITKEIFKD